MWWTNEILLLLMLMITIVIDIFLGVEKMQDGNYLSNDVFVALNKFHLLIFRLFHV